MSGFASSDLDGDFEIEATVGRSSPGMLNDLEPQWLQAVNPE